MQQRPPHLRLLLSRQQRQQNDNVSGKVPAGVTQLQILPRCISGKVAFLVIHFRKRLFLSNLTENNGTDKFYLMTDFMVNSCTLFAPCVQTLPPLKALNGPTGLRPCHASAAPGSSVERLRPPTRPTCTPVHAPHRGAPPSSCIRPPPPKPDAVECTSRIASPAPAQVLDILRKNYNMNRFHLTPPRPAHRSLSPDTHAHTLQIDGRGKSEPHLPRLRVRSTCSAAEG